jgi:hypothetical protein
MSPGSCAAHDGTSTTTGPGCPVGRSQSWSRSFVFGGLRRCSAESSGPGRRRWWARTDVGAQTLQARGRRFETCRAHESEDCVRGERGPGPRGISSPGAEPPDTPHYGWFGVACRLVRRCVSPGSALRVAWFGVARGGWFGVARGGWFGACVAPLVRRLLMAAGSALRINAGSAFVAGALRHWGLVGCAPVRGVAAGSLIGDGCMPVWCRH